ncbi:MAG: DNA repair protein RadA [Gammaproteobacteria bacterium]|nr:DNA repair protein RadA [Gammaproteobacteria bacterium]
MGKSKTAYVCSDCGADYAKWQGQCVSCREWNTLTRLSIGAKRSQSVMRSASFTGITEEAKTLDQIDLQRVPRLITGIKEFDRVLGGGLVPGSAVLIGGSPGAGKSTLLIQIMCAMAQHHTALYVTGEESLQQIAMRANRLNLPVDKLQVMTETNVEVIQQCASKLQPKLLVVDSIQVMFREDVDSAPGSVAQVRESASLLIRYAKQTDTVLLLVGHVTKDGSLAGPKVLEHMIDCFIMLEGENDSRYRTLRGSKNRFGAVNELGIFAMTDRGMMEVKNPSAIFLSRTEDLLSGSLVMVVWEGTRPLLVEAQALVDQSSLENPRRVAVGFETNRLAMLLAVLHRHGGLFVGDQDVFVNVVGGIRVTETGSDLALLLAVVSSLRDKPLSRDLVVFGEVGLSGEIRPVPNGQERLQEAAKHGFRRAIIPKGNAPKKQLDDIEVITVSKLAEALNAI